MVQGDDPPALPFLPVGTEVSAKFKGAYCEARVKTIDRELKVKVNIKESPFGTLMLPCSEFVAGTKFENGEITKVMHGGNLVKCQIVSTKDASTYLVVFNDGDEKTLRRSQMVLTKQKQSANEDQMPLTSPESFSSPVVRSAAKRGAQKMRSMHDDSETRKNDEEEEEEPRRKQRLVEGSDESFEGDKPSTSRISSDDDAESQPSTSNGAPSSLKNTEKARLREQKRREKEEERRRKLEERERKKREKLAEKERKMADKTAKREAGRMAKSRRNVDKSATVKAIEMDRKMFGRPLLRPSTRYSLRSAVIKRRRRKKRKVSKRRRVALRNYRLASKWISLCRYLGMSERTERKYQWSRTSVESVMEMMEATCYFKLRGTKGMARKWLKEVEHERHWQVVLVYEKPCKVRRLLKRIPLPDELTFSQRLSFDRDDVKSTHLRASLEIDEWYLAILLPQVFESQNCNQRLVRHTATGELMRLWEEDLIPWSWVPKLNKETLKTIAGSRPPEKRRAFRLAWKFVNSWNKNNSGMSNEFVRALLKLADLPTRQITATSGIPTLDPPPPTIFDEEPDDQEEEEESEEETDDSDASILNASEETKAQYMASYFQYFDSRRAPIPSSTIQHFDIEIFCLHQLIRKFGGPKKAAAPGAHWTKFAKKVIPQAESAGEELRLWFKANLEPFMMIQMKLEIPLDGIVQRGERKQVRPGQYSEARKRKSVTLSEAAVVVEQRRSSVSRRGGRGGGRGGARKRATPELRGSRGSTASPDPSQSDDDGNDTASSLFSRDGSERRRKRAKKDPTAAPAKKGRPRKSTGSISRATSKPPAKPRICDLTGFVFANIISKIETAQDLHACYKDGGWWAATAISGMQDFAEELLEVMLEHQSESSSYSTMSSETEHRLKEIYDQLKVSTHYKGWNQRYDEEMKLDKLMVRVEDQMASRRRFLQLPRGSELLPETMALVEDRWTTQHQINDNNRPRPPVSREAFVRLAREALMPKDEDEVEDRMDEVEDQAGPSNIQKEESEEESEGSEKSDESTMVEVEEKDQEREPAAPESESLEEPLYLERDFESESDEPEYPPAPTSPELAAMRPPVLQNIASMERMSSSGSSNYPVLSRQASSTSISSSMPSGQSSAMFSPPTAANSLSHSGPLTLAELPPKRIDDEDPMTSPLRPFQSGALTLDIPTPLDTSGPIEPTMTSSSAPNSAKRGRKTTGTPVFQKPSPSITSGPLTLSPSTSKTPKKPTTSTESDHEEEDQDHQEHQKDKEDPEEPPTEPTQHLEPKESGSSESPNEKEEEDPRTPQRTPRSRGGSTKKRRGGRFGGSYPTKPQKSTRRKEKDENQEEEEHATPTSSSTSSYHHHHPRADSFQVQKMRMAKIMEQEGTLHDYSPLADFLSDFDLSSMPPEDIPMALEERTSELRDGHAQCKHELSQLEKRFRLQNEAKRKAAEAKSSSSSEKL